MSEELSTIENTGGSRQALLQITQYYGGQTYGAMLQLTQGIGAYDTPGFIQLTYQDTYYLIQELTQWLKDESMRRREKIKALIKEHQELEHTIFKDAIECEHFIADLKVLDVPVRLLR